MNAPISGGATLTIALDGNEAIAEPNLQQHLLFGQRYLELNSRFGRPFSINLSKRGFYSEVNCLLGGMVYGLMTRRRLVVIQSDFNGRSWADYFASTLPTAPTEIASRIARRWANLDNDSPPERSDNFAAFRRRVQRRYRRRIPIWSPRLGFFGDVFSLTRQLAEAFCRPASVVTMPTDLRAQFAAIHIRRGDKVLGQMLDGTRGEPESVRQEAPIYLAAIRKHRPDLKSVFVLADDYEAVLELRAAAPDMAFATLCTPSEHGYEQRLFDNLPGETKLLQGRRLIAETEIARRSSVFVGAYGSNVARYIALMHQDPSQCFSIDNEPKWTPA